MTASYGPPKLIRRRPCSQAERDAQRSMLRIRQALQPTQHGRAQLLKGRERQLHLEQLAERSAFRETT
jgi:hypothetical protein